MKFIHIFIKCLFFGYLCIVLLLTILSLSFLALDLISGNYITLSTYIEPALSENMHSIYIYVTPIGAFITALFIYTNINRNQQAQPALNTQFNPPGKTRDVYVPFNPVLKDTYSHIPVTTGTIGGGIFGETGKIFINHTIQKNEKK